MKRDIFRGYGVEVRLPDRQSFLKVMETLTRIGIPNNEETELYQLCHILHKQGRYAIIHFQELHALDGSPVALTENDIKQRNLIASLVSEWLKLEIVDPNKVADQASIKEIRVIPYREKEDWKLIAQHSIGKKRDR